VHVHDHHVRFQLGAPGHRLLPAGRLSGQLGLGIARLHGPPADGLARERQVQLETATRDALARLLGLIRLPW